LKLEVAGPQRRRHRASTNQAEGFRLPHIAHGQHHRISPGYLALERQ
jgi:hypothetical protein